MIASCIKGRIIDIILIALFVAFIATPPAALFWHQPKIYLVRSAASSPHLEGN
jgi:hypothetical protein